jgi:hypothetical protein
MLEWKLNVNHPTNKSGGLPEKQGIAWLTSLSSDSQNYLIGECIGLRPIGDRYHRVLHQPDALRYVVKQFLSLTLFGMVSKTTVERG